MEPLSFRLATLNTGLVRVEIFNLDVREAIPARRERQEALPALLLEADHDIICLQEVFSRPQQQWLKRALADGPWQVIGSTDGALPGQRNWGLVTLVRRDLFTVITRRDVGFHPADWTEVLFGPKGAMALELAPKNIEGQRQKHSSAQPGVSVTAQTSPYAPAPSFWVVNLHATYGGLNHDFAGDAATELRTQQLRKIGQEFGDQRAFLVGDYNAGPHVSRAAYNCLTQEFGATDVIAPGENPLSFRTWDPSNPLHDSILNRDGVVHDEHHGRIDHIFGTARVQKHYHTTNAKMIWDQPVISANALRRGAKVCPSDHYGLELCVTAR